MSKFNTPQKWKKIMKHAQNRRCTSSICEQLLGKVWMKRNKDFWSYRLHKLGTPKVLRTAKCLSSTPLKNEKKIMKHAQNRRCTSSICEQSFGKVWMKRNKNFWSYRLHKLGIPKMLHTAKCLRSTPLKNEKKIWNVHKIEGAHLQYVNNHLAKFEWKGIKTFGVTDYTNLVPLKCCGRPNV